MVSFTLKGSTAVAAVLFLAALVVQCGAHVRGEAQVLRTHIMGEGGDAFQDVEDWEWESAAAFGGVGSSVAYDLAQLQARLNALGYPAGHVDGVWGARTRLAVGGGDADACVCVCGVLAKRHALLLPCLTFLCALCIRYGAKKNARLKRTGCEGAMQTVICTHT